MNKARWISRLVFLLLTVALLVYINRKSNDNTMSMVEFKYRTFKKIERDSLDAKHKLDLLVDETTKFIDDSTRVKKGIRYLTLVFGILVVVELGFLIFTKRNYGRR
jgi:hypothetical protein